MSDLFDARFRLERRQVGALPGEMSGFFAA